MIATAFFEDLTVGEVVTTPARTITETDVVQFAGLTGDYNPLHTDRVFAEATQFGERIAHGLLGLSISSGLVARTGMFEGTALAFLGLREWNFRKPIVIGDTVHVEFEIAEKRLASDGRRGVVTRAMRLVRQDGAVLQEGTAVLLVKCREAQDD